MSLNANRCPRCFRLITEHTWTDDPVKSITGCPFYYDEGTGFLISQSDPTLRLYKGINIITAIQFKEIQDYYKGLEEIYILPLNRTIFTTVENKTIIQKIHITEIRSSIEKLLSALGVDKSTFLSYDESNVQRQNPEQVDWIDAVINDGTKKTIIDDKHIEDLRKYLQPDIPMHIMNRGTYNVSHQVGDSITSICYDDYFYRELGYGSGFIYWNTFRLDEMYGSHSEDDYHSIPYPEVVYNPEHAGDEFEYTVFGGYPLRGFLILEKRTFWDSRRYAYSYDSFLQSITCIPSTPNLLLPAYSLQEIVSSTLPVYETPGYPVQMYVGDSWEYFVAPFKSPNFLEDCIENLGNLYEIPVLTYPDTKIFKADIGGGTGLTPTGGSSGNTENAVDTRRIDPTSWGLSYPPPELINPAPGYCNGVAISGTNPLGNCSIFLPKTYLGSGYKSHLKNAQIGFTFTDDDGMGNIYFGTRSTFMIDITGESFEDDIYDETTETFVPRNFGNNTILAKRDDDNCIAGCIVARGYQENTIVTDPSTNVIQLPDNTIARSVKMNYSGDEWTRVIDFSLYTSTSKVFIVESIGEYDLIKFGDGEHGALAPSATATYISYQNEIPYSTYYAGGWIVIPYELALVGQSVYVYIDYYAVIWSYFAISSPETLYQMEYLYNDKLHKTDIPGALPSGTYPPGQLDTVPIPSGVGSGNILPIITPQPVTRLYNG